jgi:hypothetical protein
MMKKFNRDYKLLLTTSQMISWKAAAPAPRAKSWLMNIFKMNSGMQAWRLSAQIKAICRLLK